MNMATKKDIFTRYLSEYLAASKIRKSEILAHICDVTSMHRKAVIRTLGRMQLNGGVRQEKRGRKTYYTPDVNEALRVIWQAASEVCGELVHPIIREYVAILQRDGMWLHSEETTKKLLAMSEATVKRRVGHFQGSRLDGRGISATNPSALKEIIPIVTSEWADKPPGYGQVDTVVHCGSSLKGDMIFSVNYTDLATLRVSFRAQWNKGFHATKESLIIMQRKVPFPILGIHPDTGGEFINWALKHWCDREGIELSRSRPGHKNDNAYVEQKNGHVIRRLDHSEVLPLMNELYDSLEIYLNHFVPSRKCLEKVRVGSKYKRVYAKGTTAYQRVLDHPDISKEVKARLKAEHAHLNPLLLSRQVATLKENLFTLNRTLEEPVSVQTEKLAVG